MNSVTPLPGRRHEPAVQPIRTVEPAANDQTHPVEENVEENDTRDPLWIVAIGMAVLFAVLAAVVGLSN